MKLANKSNARTYMGLLAIAVTIALDLRIKPDEPNVATNPAS